MGFNIHHHNQYYLFFPMKKEPIIVKVQTSLFTNNSKPMVLVYDEKQEIFYQGILPRDIKKKMNGEPKMFFYAHIKNKRIILDDVAPWQDW